MMIVLGKVAKAPQGNARVAPHERARLTKAWRQAAFYQARETRLRHGACQGRQTITVTHERADQRRADPDNVSSIAKPVIDGLVDGGLLADDSWKHVAEVRLRVVPGCDTERFVIELEGTD